MVFGSLRSAHSTSVPRRLRLPCVPPWPADSPPASDARRGLCAAHRVLSGDRSSATGVAYATITLVTVLLAVASTCTASLQSFRTPSGGYTSDAFFFIDVAVVIVFASEWMTRLFTAIAVPDDEELRWWAARAAGAAPTPYALGAHLPAPPGFRISALVAARRMLRFTLQPTALLDLVAWLPTALAILIGATSAPNQTSVAGLNVLRLTRVLYLVKLTRMSSVLLLLQATIRASLDVLGTLLIFVAVIVIVLGSAVFAAEQGSYDPAGPSGPGWYRPMPFGGGTELTCFTSVPQAMWFVLVTLTTVGYGDCVPTTAGGKVVGSIAALTGVITVALPVSVLSANFSAAYSAFAAARHVERAERRRRHSASRGAAGRRGSAASVHASAHHHDGTHGGAGDRPPLPTLTPFAAAASTGAFPSGPPTSCDRDRDRRVSGDDGGGGVPLPPADGVPDAHAADARDPYAQLTALAAKLGRQEARAASPMWVGGDATGGASPEPFESVSTVAASGARARATPAPVVAVITERAPRGATALHVGGGGRRPADVPEYADAELHALPAGGSRACGGDSDSSAGGPHDSAGGPHDGPRSCGRHRRAHEGALAALRDALAAHTAHLVDPELRAAALRLLASVQRALDSGGGGSEGLTAEDGVPRRTASPPALPVAVAVAPADVAPPA